jgi:mevalonate kinase
MLDQLIEAMEKAIHEVKISMRVPPNLEEKIKLENAEQQIHSINRILKVMGVVPHETPIRITYGGDLLAGSGVGSSAASCVSLARALNAEFNKGLTIDEINTVGWEGEFAYHGTPSGVDNTASTYGGLLFYRIKNGEKTFDRIKIEKPFEVVLGNSGVTADTSALGTFLEDLCDFAVKLGALGAKVTGGGRGGYMIALTPGKESQEKVASAIAAKGYKVIRATIGGN